MNDPFNETNTSYYHKSIGGYHAAKLKRYQELIDNRLAAEISTLQQATGSHFQNAYSQLQTATFVEGQKPEEILVKWVQDSLAPTLRNSVALNMLNAKYMIFHPELPAIENKNAMGNAWFVSEYKFVENADAEITEITSLFDPQQVAVVDKRFEAELSGLSITPDSTATIELTSYKPNILTYKSKANSEQLAVFSEIYFSNGWKAFVDGEEVPHLRADWTLRAMRVPAGEHEIVFKFEPEGYNNSRLAATASSGLLILLLIAMLGFSFKKKED